MQYSVEVLPAAARELRKLSRQNQARVVAKIEKLAERPRPQGCTKLEGKEGVYRVRAGDYRVLYQVLDKRLVVLVIRIGHRSDVYRHTAA